MNIKLMPQNEDISLAVEKLGDILTINGVTYDFTELPDGATLPAEAISSDFILGEVSRVDGQIELTLRMPHAHGASEAARFPEPLINPDDGLLELPI